MNRFIAAAFLLVGLISVASGVNIVKPHCDDTTSSKHINLVSPFIPTNSCDYHIKTYSKHVCQIRIDFAMTLAQPSRPSSNNHLQYAECVNDYFQVGDIKLCGSETNQHIYVSLTQDMKDNGVDVKFVIATRFGASLPKPHWDMIVTQLECASSDSLEQTDSFVPQVIDNEADHYHHNEHIKKMAVASVSDGFLLAPAGCLQYFPQAHGFVNSFNYNNGRGIYPGNMNYAICFRRTAETTGMEIKPMFFSLGAEFGHLNILEVDNYCFPQRRTVGVSEDYLMIPQALMLQTEMHATYFCGDSLKGTTVLTQNPGPLMVLFHSDALFKQGETGFVFSYDILQ